MNAQKLFIDEAGQWEGVEEIHGEVVYFLGVFVETYCYCFAYILV